MKYVKMLYTSSRKTERKFTLAWKKDLLLKDLSQHVLINLSIKSMAYRPTSGIRPI
jgi:hypothetical protein